jgi:hypothetical protein
MNRIKGSWNRYEMNLLSYFYFEKIDSFFIYRLKPEKKEDFLCDITSEFRQCYITDKKLKKNADDNLISASKFLEDYILPSEGKIKSGDFGEMLSYFLVIEHYALNEIKIFAPRKWRWKEERNRASPFSDAVGFYREDESNPSNNDFVVCVESKMKATISNKHRIQEAIDGANKDRVSRLGKTLCWLREKYAKGGLAEMREFIERYSDPVGKKTYKKFFKAFTILDIEFETQEFTQLIKNADGISIIIISMEHLRDVYEENLRRIIESV